MINIHRSPKYWLFSLKYSHISLTLWKTLYTLEKRSVQPFTALFYDANSDRSPLPSSGTPYEISRPSLQHASSRSISLFNFYDGELERRFAWRSREFSSHDVTLTRSSLGKIVGLASWRLTTLCNVCAIIKRECSDAPSEENSPDENTTFHFLHITSAQHCLKSLQLTLIKLSVFYS